MVMAARILLGAVALASVYGCGRQHRAHDGGPQPKHEEPAPAGGGGGGGGPQSSGGGGGGGGGSGPQSSDGRNGQVETTTAA